MMVSLNRTTVTTVRPVVALEFALKIIIQSRCEKIWKLSGPFWIYFDLFYCCFDEIIEFCEIFHN
jgi:hypothetical protein